MNNKIFSRVLFTVAGVLVPTALFAGNAAVPHTFAPNTPAKASDVNDNFAAVLTALNKTTSFQHVTSSANTNGFTTCIDNPMTNGDPNAMVLFTRVNGNGHLFTYFGTELVLSYELDKWCISREDKLAMPADVLFNVTVVKP